MEYEITFFYCSGCALVGGPRSCHLHAENGTDARGKFYQRYQGYNVHVAHVYEIEVGEDLESVSACLS